jgi:hypothetical protein
MFKGSLADYTFTFQTPSPLLSNENIAISFPPSTFPQPIFSQSSSQFLEGISFPGNQFTTTLINPIADTVTSAHITVSNGESIFIEQDIPLPLSFQP